MRKAKHELHDLRKKNKEFLEEVLPAEVEKAIKREREHTAVQIRKIQQEMEVVMRELSKEKVNRQAAKKEHEQRAQASEFELALAKRSVHGCPLKYGLAGVASPLTSLQTTANGTRGAQRNAGDSGLAKQKPEAASDQGMCGEADRFSVSASKDILPDSSRRRAERSSRRRSKRLKPRTNV